MFECLQIMNASWNLILRSKVLCGVQHLCLGGYLWHSVNGCLLIWTPNFALCLWWTVFQLSTVFVVALCAHVVKPCRLCTASCTVEYCSVHCRPFLLLCFQELIGLIYVYITDTNQVQASVIWIFFCCEYTLQHQTCCDSVLHKNYPV